MRGEMTPRDLRVQQKISNGRTIHQDPSRRNQAIEYDRGPLDARRSYRGKPAFATEGVKADARHSHRITPAFANDGDRPTEVTSRRNRRAEPRGADKNTHGTAIAEAIPTSKGAIRTSKGEIGYWRWGSSDMTLPTSTVMELKGCQRE